VKETKKLKKTWRVLVAEDDPLLAKLLSNLLQKEGYNVQLAANGDQALLAFLKFNPDLALLDFAMPGFDGLEVAEKFRSACASIPIILMTGLSQPEIRHHAHKLGIRYFLPKPFSLQDAMRMTQLCSVGAMAPALDPHPPAPSRI
jgi:CheY-like chemotaxis protein